MKNVDKIKKVNQKPPVKPPIKILNLVKRKMAVMGIIANQQQNNCWQINRRQGVCLILFFIVINLFIAFALCGANGTEEYMVSIFLITSAVTTAIGFVSIIYKNDKVFNVIEHCEEEINTSK